MKNYHCFITTLLESSDLLSMIPKPIQKNYQIIGDFSNSKNWAARIYENNSQSDSKFRVGDYQEIYYVIFSGDGKQFLPIATNDEHHRGFDIYYELSAKYKFNFKNPVSVNIHGNNYIYEQYDSFQSKVPSLSLEDQLRELIAPLRMYLSFGGNDSRLLFKFRKNDFDLTCSTKQIVDSNGDWSKLLHTVESANSQVTELGRAFLDDWKNLANKSSDDRRRVSGKLQINRLVNAVTDLLNKYKDDVGYEIELRQIQKQLKSMSKDSDYNEIYNFVFGYTDPFESDFENFHGIKNYIHNCLRIDRELGLSKSIRFGNLDVVIAEFGSI